MEDSSIASESDYEVNFLGFWAWLPDFCAVRDIGTVFMKDSDSWIRGVDMSGQFNENKRR